MKNRLSLVLSVALLGSVSAFAADSLQDALKGGKVSGDVAVTYETRNIKEKDANPNLDKIYYQDTAYSVGSIGLNYETGSFYGFSANVGMRAYGKLWEDDKKSTTWHGTGDASERFYEDGHNRSVDLANAYLAYTLKDVMTVKVGRQTVSTEWLTKYIDGVTAIVTPVKNLELEMIYAQNIGRIYARDYRPMKEINDNDGIYKLGATYTIVDGVKAKVYGMIAPDSHDIYGGKVSADLKAGDVGYGGLVHYAKSDEDKDKHKGNEDGKVLELVGYASYAGYKGTLGYVKTGKKAGWGSMANYGDTVVQFEEGDAMYERDARTLYGMISKSFFDVSLTALYGQTKYRMPAADSKEYKSNELSFWASYNFTKNLSADLGYSYINTSDNDTNKLPDLNQVNLTLTYKF